MTDQRCSLVVLLALATLACAGPNMHVQFHNLPRSVESVDPRSCHLLSRSRMAHLMRIALSAEKAGERVRIDDERVKLTISNHSRSQPMGVFDLPADGTASEVLLKGPVDLGDELELSGSFTFASKHYEFSQTCLVD